MLRADNLSYRYTPLTPWVFRNVSFTLSPGEIAGLPGPSGMGKTTLAKILAGYLSPVEGEVLLNGSPLAGRGFSPVQLLFQHPELTVNPRWKAGKIISEGFTPSRRLLERFEIDGEWLKRYPCELSGGQLARIAMVRVLSDRTKFLITDEITSMLDAVTQARMWKMLIKHAEENGMGLLVISHDSHLLNRLCHRMIPVFDQGVGIALEKDPMPVRVFSLNRSRPGEPHGIFAMLLVQPYSRVASLLVKPENQDVPLFFVFLVF